MPRTLLLPPVGWIGALACLAGCGGGPSSPGLTRLAHPDPAERLAAIAALDRAADPATGDALLRVALGDPEPRIRRAAALVLESGEGDSLERLAVLALERTRDPLLAGWMLAHHLEALRLAAVPALRQAGTPGAWGLLAARMGSDPSDGVRLLCAQAVAEGAAGGAGEAQDLLLAALRRGLSDPHPSLRQASARALARAGDPSGVSVLADALPQASLPERRTLLALLRVATGVDLGQDAGPWTRRFGSRPGTKPVP